MGDIDNIIEFSIAAWNFGNLSLIIGKEEFKKIIAHASDENINIKLLHEMIYYKATNFEKHKSFIVDYELEERNGEQILSIITQEEDAYLASMLNHSEEETAPDEFEENYIDRYAIIIKPLQPFIDWNNAIYPDEKINTSNFEESNIYLVDENIKNLEAWLKKKYDRFFTIELYDWHTNKKDWPQNRNYKMFKEWFQVEISKSIYDLEKTPISKF